MVWGVDRPERPPPVLLSHSPRACRPQALELNPNYDNAYHNRAVAYNNKGLYDECIQDCNYATSLNPYFDKAYFNRGFAYNSKGMYSNAVEDFTKAIELNPRYAMVFFSRGFAYQQSERYEEATADYEKTLELDPNFEQARQQIVQIQQIKLQNEGTV